MVKREQDTRAPISVLHYDVDKGLNLVLEFNINIPNKVHTSCYCVLDLLCVKISQVTWLLL